jgi:hypothetical protein
MSGVLDSRANSEDVLRIIRENKIGMKVLLGAWLDAETNNPDCPWLKPASQQVLDGNKDRKSVV